MKSVDYDHIFEEFKRRYRIKKTWNAYFNLFISLCGSSSVLYSVVIFKSNLLDRLRYMTFNGTIFTSVVSFVTFVVSLLELSKYTEVTKRSVYFLRLSSACTEFVIFAVVLIGLLPILPDKPDIITYPGVMMHLVVPICTLTSFIFNDAPIGKLKPYEPLYGTSLVTIYAIVSTIIFATGILPSSMAPYSFLDFEHHSIFFSLSCLAVIYAIGYSISLLLSVLNRKLSWLWFKNLTNKIKQ